MTDWHPDLAKLQAYDDGEWQAVHDAYVGRLLAYVSRRIRDAQGREDVIQETLLGAVRGIASFDPIYTFEQYLFGICHNRTIDHLRRVRPQTAEDASEEVSAFDELVVDEETPSRVVRGEDLASAARAILALALKEWVQETWQAEEFVRLSVIEALIVGGWRNKDTWERFGLRDETAVAGVKFRALKRLGELARAKDPLGELLANVMSSMDDGDLKLDFDVAKLWRELHASCPARHWWARWLQGSLEEGPTGFLGFHLNEMHCAWCAANVQDLQRKSDQDELAPLLERVQASTLAFLRSRTIGSVSR